MSANVSIFLINWLVSYVDGLQHSSRGEKHAQHCVLPWSRHISQTAPFPPRHLGPALSLKSQDASTSEPTTAPSVGGQRPSFIIAMAMTSNAFGLCVEKNLRFLLPLPNMEALCGEMLACWGGLAFLSSCTLWIPGHCHE